MSACEEFRTESSDAEIWSSCQLLVTTQAGTGVESLGEYFPTFRKILATPSSGSSRPKARERGQQIQIDLRALHRGSGDGEPIARAGSQSPVAVLSDVPPVQSPVAVRALNDVPPVQSPVPVLSDVPPVQSPVAVLSDVPPVHVTFSIQKRCQLTNEWAAVQFVASKPSSAVVVACDP